MRGYLSVRASIRLSWTAASSVDGARSSVVSAQDRRHLSSQQSPSVDASSLSSLFLCSSLSVPALLCLFWEKKGGGGVLIFHPASNRHIEGLVGRPAGGQREHAALAVVLFQTADKMTTFILPGTMKTAQIKKKGKNPDRPTQFQAFDFT